MTHRLKMDIVPVETVKEAFVGSDVISTATMARTPYVDKEWYKPGAFHAEISFWDTPPEALTAFDRIFVDDWSQVKHHGVDVSWRAVKEVSSLKKISAGNSGRRGRKNTRPASKDDRIFFNPIGMGIHDLSEAYRVYQSAIEKGVGTTLTYFERNSGWLDSLSL